MILSILGLNHRYFLKCKIIDNIDSAIDRFSNPNQRYHIILYSFGICIKPNVKQSVSVLPHCNLKPYNESFLFQNLMEFPAAHTHTHQFASPNTCKLFVFVTISSTSRRLPGQQNLCMPHNLGTIISFAPAPVPTLVILDKDWKKGETP